MLSELVTNAVVHAAGDLHVQADQEPGRLVVQVCDDDPAQPVIRHSRVLNTATGGRGIEILQALAEDWGVRHHPGDGKTVWFEVQW